MKTALLWTSFLIASLFLAMESHAAPLINNLSVQEQDIWLGETETVFLDCTDDISNITGAFADISTATAIFPANQFKLDASGRYYLAISTAPSSNFNKAGAFNVTAYCRNALGETANSTAVFTVSNLSMEISKITSPAYIGDIAEINVNVKKDGNPITPPLNVHLEVSLDGTNVSLASPPYWDSLKGWVLKFDTKQQASGGRALSITAKYGRAQASATSAISILPAVDFSVASIDKTWMSANDEITVLLKATERGNPVQMKTEYLSVQIDSASVGITDLSPSASLANGYAMKFAAPPISAGEHALKIHFSYNNYSNSYSKSISYVVPVAGKIYLNDEKYVPLQLKFTSSGADKTIKTDNAGAYSILLPPATYNIQISDDASVLDISGAKIDNFEDGLKYQPLSSGTVRGIQGAGVFFFGAAFKYSGARLKIPYNQGKINDESELRTYSCANWNSGRKECLSEWKEIISSIDTVRKIANVNVSGLNAAYIVGSPDIAAFEASPEKSTYSTGEKIVITGISQDGAKNALPNASITAALKGMPITASAQSNAQGIFSLEIQNPGAEGAYSVAVSISKSPYLSSQKEINFTVAKSKDVSIVGPDTVRLSPGESSDVQFRIINAGESDLTGLDISINGIPSNYYKILPSDTVESIKSNEEKTATVRFNAPGDAAKATFGATFEISKSDFSRKQSFALTILPPSDTSIIVSPQAQVSAKSDAQANSSSSLFSFGIPTALSTFGVAGSDAAYLAAFAVLSISAALALRKRRISKLHSSTVKTNNRRLIFEIKSRVSESEKTKTRRLSGKGGGGISAGYAKRRS